MKSHLYIVKAMLFAWCLSGLSLQADVLHVVTTYTDLAEFVREVGGSRVEVQSLTTGVEDSHGIPVKPSFLPLLNRADLLVVIGMSNEHSYLPALLGVAKNGKIMEGQSGYVDCSKYITPIDVPVSTDRSQGDVHASGNPHYNLDPVAARSMLKVITEALIDAAPSHRDEFTQRRDVYLSKLNTKIIEWKTLAAPLRGMKFISYHEHWPYLASRYGMEPMGTIELKPGIDPTPRHIVGLIQKMKEDHIRVVVREPQFPEKLPKEVAEKTGAKLIKLPIMVGGVPEADNYIDMIDYILHQLLIAAQAT